MNPPVPESEWPVCCEEHMVRQPFGSDPEYPARGLCGAIFRDVSSDPCSFPLGHQTEHEQFYKEPEVQARRPLETSRN